ncbi:MAG: glutamate--tRNA ligase [Chloroflexi bacterium]|nr:glutamate--tRNA ligase [Chloroflexota bacterium]
MEQPVTPSGNERPVRVRIAPSPTGDPHVGTAYIALFDVAFARQQGGKFVLRIEDTDRERLIPASEGRIFAMLRWLGLDWDEGPDVGGPYGPYRQSERKEIYGEYADQLIATGHAYRCWCTPERLARAREEQMKLKLPPKYDRFCLGKSEEQRRAEGDFSEPPVVRMLVPNEGETSFQDLLRGEISFKNELIDDQVLLKSDGFPTYHLAVVVDDFLMQISHVVRGEEWVSSTPKHVLLYRFFGWELPQFAHLSILRNSDKNRSKISKRRNPWAVLPWFYEAGYLPEALINYLALMGFSILDPDDPGNTREIFGIEDIVKHFAWERLGTTAPVFDLEKLDWLNGQYVRKLAVADLVERVRPFLERAGLDVSDADYLSRVVAVEQERIHKLGDAPGLVSFFFQSDLEYDPALLIPKGLDAATARRALEAARECLVALDRYVKEEILPRLRAAADRLGLKHGNLFWPLRVAVTGRLAAPPLDETLYVLGKDRTLRRIDAALRQLDTLL